MAGKQRTACTSGYNLFWSGLYKSMQTAKQHLVIVPLRGCQEIRFTLWRQCRGGKCEARRPPVPGGAGGRSGTTQTLLAIEVDSCPGHNTCR